MFRTGDALGVTHFYLSGFTPAPLDRFGRIVKELAKTALGAEQSIPWESLEQPLPILARLKHEGFIVIAIEQDAKAIDYKTYIAPEKVLVVVGSEVEGVPSELSKECDVIVEIPMQGKKESLNVSVAFGVALFRILGQ